MEYSFHITGCISFFRPTSCEPSFDFYVPVARVGTYVFYRNYCIACFGDEKSSKGESVLKSFGEIMSSRIKKAYGVQEALHDDLVRVQGVVTREVTDLQDRLNEINVVIEGLHQTVENINQKMVDLDNISAQIGKQYSAVSAAMGVSKESIAVSEEQSDTLASGVTLGVSRAVYFSEDDRLVSEVLTAIKPKFLARALKRLNKEELSKLREALQS